MSQPLDEVDALARHHYSTIHIQSSLPMLTFDVNQ
jgi:hypothetical protein